ncbi:MAG: anion permease [Trueperaceae bacterium]
MISTMLLTDLINDNATAVLMAPLAIEMAVAICSSCAFLTPIGHQSNTLVLEPGGYRFQDYWRMGLPLDVLIVLIAVPMILWVWPL